MLSYKCSSQFMLFHCELVFCDVMRRPKCIRSFLTLLFHHNAIYDRNFCKELMKSRDVCDFLAGDSIKAKKLIILIHLLYTDGISVPGSNQIYRLGTVNSNTVNPKFLLNQTFFISLLFHV